MKKKLALVLTMISICTFSTTAFAENTTTLTTAVPDATYTLNIPADQEIAFGATSTSIGNVTVTDASGFAEGKDLQVTVTYDDFTCNDVRTTIPYSLALYESQYKNTKDLPTEESFLYKGKYDGTTYEQCIIADRTSGNVVYPVYAEELLVKIKSSDWGKALAGSYSTTITFTSEVVVSE